MKYRTAAENARTEHRSLANDPALNEFYRYYELDSAAEPFHRVATIAREVKHFAPGSTADGELDPFNVPVPLLNGVGNLPSRALWDEAKNHILALEDKNARIDYYCGEGRDGYSICSRALSKTRVQSIICPVIGLRKPSTDSARYWPLFDNVR